MCRECLRYHLDRDELPAFYFDMASEKTYDRSIENFIRIKSQK